MLVNLTLLTRDRPKLLQQALDSLAAHTDWTRVNLTILDDGSRIFDSLDIVQRSGIPFNRVQLMYTPDSTGGAGAARNKVIRLAQAKWGRGDLLYLSDNDVYFQEHWLEQMLTAWELAVGMCFEILGGYSHPFNANSPGCAHHLLHWGGAEKSQLFELRECWAVATQSMLLSWETWDRFGPFPETPGVRQSEDVQLCNRVREAGGKVGYLWPHPVLNTSLTDTFGERVPGYEHLRAETPETIYME